jgi:5-methyltetrahydropteroyltriglutamate--homocysteine methyltransferase
MKFVTTSSLGFPRMGPNRELKFALEKYWKGTISQDDLLQVARSVEDAAWALHAGLTKITVGDQYLYDFVLMMTESLGIVPKRFANLPPGIDRLFAMARGIDGAPALSKLTCTFFSFDHQHSLSHTQTRHEEVDYK